MNIIYGLIDPRTLLIHYVGLSSKGLKRPKAHRRKSSQTADCGKWVKQLHAEGLNYEVAVLETVTDEANLPSAERWWIAYGRCCGWPLTNCNAGGAFNRRFRRPRLRVSHEDMQQATMVNACNLMYKYQGADAALQAAGRVLSTEILEWFIANVIEHSLNICSELPPRLICPCGRFESFNDETSLITAIRNMSQHVSEMVKYRDSEASQARRWMLHP